MRNHSRHRRRNFRRLGRCRSLRWPGSWRSRPEVPRSTMPPLAVHEKTSCATAPPAVVGVSDDLAALVHGDGVGPTTTQGAKVRRRVAALGPCSLCRSYRARQAQQQHAAGDEAVAAARCTKRDQCDSGSVITTSLLFGGAHAAQDDTLVADRPRPVAACPAALGRTKPHTTNTVSATRVFAL